MNDVPDPRNMSTDWSKPTRYIIGVSLALLGIYILYISRSIIPLLIIAALIAVIVRPLILWLHQRARIPRGLAVALVYLGVLILVPLLLLLTIPAIIDAVNYVVSLDYQSISRGFTEWLRSTLNGIKNLPLPAGGINQYIDQTVDAILVELGSQTPAEQVQLPSVTTIIRSIGTALTATFRTAAGVVGSVFSRVALLLFMFLASIYISLGAHTYQDSFMRAVPVRFRPEISTLIARIVHMWNAFFRGELTLMLVIGTLSWLGLTILGVPGALYLGIVAGLLELIPNLGPIIATIPAVIVALLQGSTYLPVSTPVFALIVVGLYVLIQQLENNLIVPRVLGGAVDLPPLVVMSGVLIGAEVAGLLGALLATPVIATVRELVRYAYLKILGENPFPPGDDLPTLAPSPFSQARVWVGKLQGWRRFLPGKKQQEQPKESNPGAKAFPTKD